MATREPKGAAAKAKPKPKRAPPKRQDKRGAPQGKGTVKARNGGKIGNPAFTPTAEQKRMVESHAAVGTPHELICEFIINPATGLPISGDTLTRHFEKELAFGLAKTNARIGGLVAKAALKGCKTRQIFWMKHRGGWASKHAIELAGPGGGPIPTTTKPNLDLKKLSKEELRQLEKLTAKASPDAPL